MIQYLKKLIQKYQFRKKLKKMDDLWYFMGGNCFGLFPPSFYYIHSEEEIKRITAEEIQRLQKMIAQLENDNPKKQYI